MAKAAKHKDETEVHTSEIEDIMKQVGELSYEDRKAFAARFNEVLNRENDKRSVGHDFDKKEYS